MDKAGHLIADIFMKSLINAVGTDGFKGKSMIIIQLPAKEVVVSSFEVSYDSKDFSDLVKS